MKHFFILLHLLFFYSSTAFGQLDHVSETKPIFNKNAIHGSIGTVVLYASVSGYFERMLFDRLKRNYLATFVRVGIGHYGGLESSGSFTLIQTGIMTGKDKGHFEGAFGLAHRTNKNDNNYEPAIVAGYRWQKPEGNFIFRTGVAYPESLYAGVGFCF